MKNDVAGDTVLDVEAYFSISNFGALIELDKAVYNWTDTVYITITSPDWNHVNTAAEESIGTSTLRNSGNNPKWKAMCIR